MSLNRNSLVSPCIEMLARQSIVYVIVALSVGLAACDQREPVPKTVATVNGKPITATDLDNELTRMGLQKELSLHRQQALDSLVEQHLLQAEALRQNIDQDPAVIAAIESARAKILAKAYIQNRVALINQPDKHEIENYFNRHPELFSERKMFDLEEIELPAALVSSELKAVMENAQSMEDITAWLEGRRIAFTQAKVVRTTLDMPATVVARLASMQPGQMLMTDDGEKALLISIKNIHQSPVTLEASAKQIAQMLVEQKQRELMDAERGRLRSIATIEYMNAADKQLAKAQSALGVAKPLDIANNPGIATGSM